MTEKEKEQVLHLYFNRLFSYEEIQKYFKNKFSYSEIKSVIKARYDQYNYDGTKKSKIEEILDKELSRIKKGEIMAKTKVEVAQNMRDRLIYYYSKKHFVLDEICNLLGISKTLVSQICKEEFEKGTLVPRREKTALKNRTPNGQGKDYSPSGIGKGGRNCEKKKFTAEQEQQIIVDYYENDMTWAELQDKWGINSPTMQILRKRAEPIYGKKKTTPNRNNKPITVIPVADKLQTDNS